jgi:hypothetical protein
MCPVPWSRQCLVGTVLHIAQVTCTTVLWYTSSWPACSCLADLGSVSAIQHSAIASSNICLLNPWLPQGCNMLVSGEPGVCVGTLAPGTLVRC